MALADLWLFAKMRRRECEVVDPDLDHDRVAGLPGAVAG